jgi:hypothetical protein
MKYWSELNRLETQIIRLETMRSLFSLIASGAEQSSEEDIRNALWYVEGSLSDIHNEMRNEFEELWDIVKNDYSEELVERVKHKGGMKKKKMMTDKELP